MEYFPAREILIHSGFIFRTMRHKFWRKQETLIVTIFKNITSIRILIY